LQRMPMRAMSTSEARVSQSQEGTITAQLVSRLVCWPHDAVLFNIVPGAAHTHKSDSGICLITCSKSPPFAAHKGQCRQRRDRRMPQISVVDQDLLRADSYCVQHGGRLGEQGSVVKDCTCLAALTIRSLPERDIIWFVQCKSMTPEQSLVNVHRTGRQAQGHEGPNWRSRDSGHVATGGRGACG
jgi:hypothetical protein